MYSIATKPSKFYSPLRYPGGKAQLSNFLSRTIEKNKLHKYTYLEPYAGGAGAALTLLYLEKVEEIVINDFDKAIYSFWKSAIHNTADFIERIKETKLTIDEWYNYREIYRSGTDDEFELGFSTFYLNRTNRSGIIEGGPIGGHEQLGNWKLAARFNKEGLIERFKKLEMYKNRISVLNRDGIDLIQEYFKNAKTFIYLDPPYFVKGSSLYLNHYLSNNHKQLAECLSNNMQAKWVLTYDDVPEIVHLYENFQKINFSFFYHADKPKKGNEILVHSNSIALDLPAEQIKLF